MESLKQKGGVEAMLLEMQSNLQCDGPGCYRVACVQNTAGEQVLFPSHWPRAVLRREAQWQQTPLLAGRCAWARLWEP